MSFTIVEPLLPATDHHHRRRNKRHRVVSGRCSGASSLSHELSLPLADDELAAGEYWPDFLSLPLLLSPIGNREFQMLFFENYFSI
nr:hypothetical protein Itr_chr12CG17760 [Ipomoea trifida]